MARAASPTADAQGRAQGRGHRRPTSGRRPSAGNRPPSGRPTLFPAAIADLLRRRMREIGGLALIALGLALLASLISYAATDPSWNRARGGEAVANWLGPVGAYPADLLIQTLGGAAYLTGLVPLVWGWRLMRHRPVGPAWVRLLGLVAVLPLAAAMVAPLAAPESWIGVHSQGGALGAILMGWVAEQVMPYFGWVNLTWLSLAMVVPVLTVLLIALGIGLAEWRGILAFLARWARHGLGWLLRHAWWLVKLAWHYIVIAVVEGSSRVRTGGRARLMPRIFAPGRHRSDGAGYARGHAGGQSAGNDPFDDAERAADGAPPWDDDGDDDGDGRIPHPPAVDRLSVTPPAGAPRPRGHQGRVAPPPKPAPPAPRRGRSGGRQDTRQATLGLDPTPGYALPPHDLLAAPDHNTANEVSPEALDANAEMLRQVLNDFGVRGDIVKVNPGPVVTLYELEPAPGTKSSRVIGLADDIARSMAAVSVRVAVVPGRNVIGIELPNPGREIVLMREILDSAQFARNTGKLALILGKDIGGTPVLADLSRMPHLLVAGTTGSGKSVAINTMILSLLYRLSPAQVRFIMIDPKMLELSVYDGIPHLLAPVVTDPRQSVVALKWTVREMEDRYRAMSKLGVRNIEGYNARLREAKAKGETLTRRVQTGYDAETGKPVFEDQPIDLTELPYIVVVVDEMADLMMVAGKDIEAAIQRLAQMARAAGIHLIMATQRPSVDVITGTIKANFPTRISFQVTSKIDSRTILGEGGAEQLLGQGDMLFMAGGGRISRVHGPFVSDSEVESVVAHLRAQGEPDYDDSVLEDEPGSDVFEAMLGNEGAGGEGGGSGDELYDRAVALVARERKASTSFVQRHLQIGYNRAARIIEQMEAEGVVSKANHVGKREVLVADHSGE